MSECGALSWSDFVLKALLCLIQDTLKDCSGCFSSFQFCPFLLEQHKHPVSYGDRLLKRIVQSRSWELLQWF